MDHPPAEEILEMLDWVCPGRKPSCSWAYPQHSIVDDIKYELRIHFNDDDLDSSTFRQITNNYMSWAMRCPDRPPLGRVIFSLNNIWTTASITVVRGSLECAEHNYIDSGASPAVYIRTSLEPIKDHMDSTYTSREYYIEGRRHRGGKLPAVERQTVHQNTSRDDDYYLETKTEHQYWEEGQPIYGPRPWQITTDVSHFSSSPGGYLLLTVKNLEAKWMVNWDDGGVPGYPVKFQAESIVTRLVKHPDQSTLLPEWNLDHAEMQNRINSRIFEGVKLFWAVKPGRIVMFTGDELFGDMGISPLDIDWAGDRFFLNQTAEFAFMCQLMSGK